jgi:hypothetical protein
MDCNNGIIAIATKQAMRNFYACQGTYCRASFYLAAEPLEAVERTLYRRGGGGVGSVGGSAGPASVPRGAPARVSTVL